MTIIEKNNPCPLCRSRESENPELDAPIHEFPIKLGMTLKTKFWAMGYFILYLTTFYYLFKHQSPESLRSPWEVLPKEFFIIYFLVTILLLILLNKKNNINFKLILISLHSFLSVSIVLIIYKIGFGFDPFVHRASETALSDLGYILPKPLYYIGQYTLVVFWSKILFLKISLVDKILIPLFASLFLPTVVYYRIQKLLSNKKLILLTTIFCILFLVSYFFYTVPQSLANLFLIILIFLGINNKSSHSHTSVSPLCTGVSRYAPTMALIAVVIILIHPLSGIPAFIYLGFLFLKQIKTKKIFSAIYFILASISIPLFFTLASFLSNNFNIEFNFANLANLANLIDLPQYLPFYSIYHLVYFYKFNLLILFILIFTVGTFYLIKNGQKKILITHYLLLITLIINLIFLSLIKFNSIINYEQLEFAKRLLQIIFLFSLPIFLSGIYFICQKILELKKGKLILIIASSLILTITLYLSYPQVNAFEKNRGYSVSKYDIKAVHWINQDAGDSDYIVLANQSTSATALQEFGFKKYYPIKNKNKIGNCFYYPIPTSSPLYDIYLKMVYNEPKISYIEEVRDLTGVNTVYFIVNDYWLDSKKRVERAGKIADSIEEVDGKVWIFKFE